MRKTLTGLIVAILMLSVSLVSANHIAAPAVPGGEYFVWEGAFACGDLLVNRFAYLTKEDVADKKTVDVLWIKYILADSENPFAASKLTFGVSAEHWVDFDAVLMRADGHFDWYFPSTQALILKYKTPCDILKR